MNTENITIITPAISYTDAEKHKSIIFADNRKKSGIYRWTSLVSGNSYVGSSVNLRARFGNYFCDKFLLKEIRRYRSIISSAILKYGRNNFRLDILEYCEPNLLIKREQHYMDTLQCEYNILKIAGSTLGVKRTPEVLLKLRGRKFSAEARMKMSLALKGKTPVFSQLRKDNHIIAVAHPVTVFDKKYNTSTLYKSKAEVRKNISISKPTLYKYIKTGLLFKNRYKFIV